MKTKATKKPKVTKLSRLKLKLKKLNIAYRKASPVQRRKMIAKDALLQIKTERFIPTCGVFTDVVIGRLDNGDTINPDSDEPLQPLLHKRSTECECCGTGALFLSYVRLANVATDRDGHSLHEIQRATDWPLDNIQLIELAFEKGKGVVSSCTEKEREAVYFGARERLQYNADARLKAILTNIVASKDGLFHP